MSHGPHDSASWPFPLAGASLTTMLATLASTLDGLPASLWRQRAASTGRRSIPARSGMMQQANDVTYPSDARVGAAGDLVRAFAAIAIGFNVLLTVIDVWMTFAFPKETGGVGGRAALAALLTLPLHLRHVVYGVRGQRPPAGAWTLAALVLANAAAFVTVGQPWMFQFASLAVSIFIVMRGRWAGIAVAAVAFSPILLVTQPPSLWPTAPAMQVALYFVLAIAWRAVTQYVPVRLVGAIRQVEEARRELEARAVVRERIRIDTELREGLGAALQRIIARGENVLAGAARAAAEAIADLRQLVKESRAALADARRIVAGYQSPTVRASLAAAAGLLETAGAQVRIVTAPDVPLDASDDRFRLAIRDALVHTLRREAAAAYRVEVGRSDDGQLSVHVRSDDP